ncbi:antitoxin [Brachybacterium hainanense]|uniref:Antitoxin n=1 Tax=Brachybacterium hainanense TaxID=1541174 RepID=A0ABV6RH12_9MICO
MKFDDALNKAKDLASENSEQVEAVIETATEKIQEKTPDQVDGLVDQGADAARDQLGLGGN